MPGKYLLREEAIRIPATLARIEAASFLGAAEAKRRTARKRYSAKPDEAPDYFWVGEGESWRV